MNREIMLLTPIITGMVGYFTNWLAIKMLFRPLEERRLCGLRLPFTPGLIPKERKRLAKAIGEAVGKHIITKDALKQALTNSTIIGDFKKEMQASAKETVEGIIPQLPHNLALLLDKNPEVDSQLNKLTQKVIEENVNKLALVFVSKDKIYATIKRELLVILTDENNLELMTQKAHELIDELAKLAETDLPEGAAEVLNKGADWVLNSIDIGKITEEQINALDLLEAEKIILSVVKRELGAITMLGGVLGFLIGLLSVGLQLIT